MTIAVSSPTTTARRTLTVCGGAHALHDGFTDLLNVLYPLLQSQFGLSYGAIGALKTCYSGRWPRARSRRACWPSASAACVSSPWHADDCRRIRARGPERLALRVIAGLILAGIGASTQHPIGSSLVAAAYHGPRSRTALGTYNFTGDVGKVLLPALFALVAAALGWQQALVVMAALAVVGAGIIIASLKPIVMHGKPSRRRRSRARTDPGPTGCSFRSTSPTTWCAPAS